MMARSATGRARGRTAPRGRSAQSPLWGEFLTRPEHNRFWLVVGFVVRRRTELTVILVGWLVFVQLTHALTPTPPPAGPGVPPPTAPVVTPAGWALLSMAVTVAVVLAVPVSRRYMWRRSMAVVMRHRLRACFLQTRTWTANGRLPFLMWSRPSRVGVRVRVWLPAGLSVNHLHRIIDELGAACWAREVRITPIRGQAALVLVDIVRRDPLSGSAPLSPPVLGRLDPAPHPAGGSRPPWLPALALLVDDSPTIPIPVQRPGPWATPISVPQPVAQAATARTDRVPTSKTAKSSTKTNGAARGDRDPAEPPAVTGFGGVDVTDYV